MNIDKLNEKLKEVIPVSLDEQAPQSLAQLRAAGKPKPKLLHRLAILYYCLSFGYFMWIWIALILLSIRFRFLIPIILAYMLYITGPGSFAKDDASWPVPFRSWGLWKACAGYFAPSQIVKTCDLDPKGTYMFIYHPHGILAFGAWLAFGTHAMNFQKLFPGIIPRILTLNINFMAPFLREYLLLHGVCSVARKALLNILEKGNSVALVVGGGSESLLSLPGRYDLVLNRRRGFVKVALDTGASLVPTIGFGETETYRTINQLPRESAVRRWQRKMELSLGFTLPIAIGVGVFSPYGIMPYPVPLNIVVGKPIDVPKFTGDKNSAEYNALVDKYHGIYKKALLGLFEEYKERYAKEAADLELIE